jgi:hypothetical protein
MLPKATSAQDQFDKAWKELGYKVTDTTQTPITAAVVSLLNIRFVQKMNLCTEGKIARTVVRHHLAVKKNNFERSDECLALTSTSPSLMV